LLRVSLTYVKIRATVETPYGLLLRKKDAAHNWFQAANTTARRSYGISFKYDNNGRNTWIKEDNISLFLIILS